MKQSDPTSWRFKPGSVVDKEGNVIPDAKRYANDDLLETWLLNHDSTWNADLKPVSVNGLLLVKINGNVYSVCPTCYYTYIYNKISHEIVGTREGICIFDLSDFLVDHNMEDYMTPKLKQVWDMFLKG